MNAKDILKYGHLTVLQVIEGLPEANWEEDGVCGVWSVREIMAHLASYEQLLVDIFKNLLGAPAGPTLNDMFANGPQGFNDNQVGARQGWNVAQTLAEYQAAQAETMALLEKLPAGTTQQTGILPWYGAEYDLDDFLVYTYYGHKREHAAQIAVFRDQIRARFQDSVPAGTKDNN